METKKEMFIKINKEELQNKIKEVAMNYAKTTKS